jgi:hypothetical protein
MSFNLILCCLLYAAGSSTPGAMSPLEFVKSLPNKDQCAHDFATFNVLVATEFHRTRTRKPREAAAKAVPDYYRMLREYGTLDKSSLIERSRDAHVGTDSLSEKCFPMNDHKDDFLFIDRETALLIANSLRIAVKGSLDQTSSYDLDTAQKLFPVLNAVSNDFMRYWGISEAYQTVSLVKPLLPRTPSEHLSWSFKYSAILLKAKERNLQKFYSASALDICSQARIAKPFWTTEPNIGMSEDGNHIVGMFRYFFNAIKCDKAFFHIPEDALKWDSFKNEYLRKHPLPVSNPEKQPIITSSSDEPVMQSEDVVENQELLLGSNSVSQAVSLVPSDQSTVTLSNEDSNSSNSSLNMNPTPPNYSLEQSKDEIFSQSEASDSPLLLHEHSDESAIVHPQGQEDGDKLPQSPNLVSPTSTDARELTDDALDGPNAHVVTHTMEEAPGKLQNDQVSVIESIIQKGLPEHTETFHSSVQKDYGVEGGSPGQDSGPSPGHTVNYQHVDTQAINSETIVSQQDDFMKNVFVAASGLSLVAHEGLNAAILIRLLDSYYAVIANALDQYKIISHEQTRFKRLLIHTIHDVGSAIGRRETPGN